MKSSCDDKDGGTHHHACDCREKYVRGLEQAADALAKASRRMDDMLTSTSRGQQPLSPKDIWSVGPAIENFKTALVAYEKIRGL